MVSQTLRLSRIVSLLAMILFFTGCSDSDDEQGSAGGSGGTVVPTGTGDLNSYLTAAINDEYRARDTYQGIIDTFGNVRPFVNIKKSEEQHIRLLVGLYNTYGIPVPPDTVGGLATPATVAAACSLGVQAEIANADMYVGLLAGTTSYPDVQDVSLYQHLPAFENCSD